MREREGGGKRKERREGEERESERGLAGMCVCVYGHVHLAGDHSKCYNMMARRQAGMCLCRQFGDCFAFACARTSLGAKPGGGEHQGGETGKAILADGRTRAFEAVSGVSTSLRGLFQRQSTSGSSARGSSVTPASSSVSAEEEQRPPAAQALEDADAALLKDLGLDSSPLRADPADPVQMPRSPSPVSDAPDFLLLYTCGNTSVLSLRTPGG